MTIEKYGLNLTNQIDADTAATLLAACRNRDGDQVMAILLDGLLAPEELSGFILTCNSVSVPGHEIRATGGGRELLTYSLAS